MQISLVYYVSEVREMILIQYLIDLFVMIQMDAIRKKIVTKMYNQQEIGATCYDADIHITK